MKFFESGKVGQDAHWVLMRGFWYGTGEGLALPSDLSAVDQDTNWSDEDLALWYSPWLRRYFAIHYSPRTSEWFAHKIRARSRAQAEAELAEFGGAWLNENIDKGAGR
jgi:hypothetical protein